MLASALEDWSNIYAYFHAGGLLSFLFTNFAELSIASLVSISPILLFGCIEYSSIPRAHRLADVVSSFAAGWPRSPFFAKFCFAVFVGLTAFKLLSFMCNWCRFLSVREYFSLSPRLSDAELAQLKWSQVVESVSANDAKLDAPKLTIAQSLLRDENYIISLVSDPSLLVWKCGSRSSVTRIPMSRFFVPIFASAVIGRPGQSLALRFRLIGLALFVFSPVLLVVTVFDFLLNVRHRRDWSPSAIWFLRNYNELPHFFRRRLAHATPWARAYFSPSLPQRFIRFVSGFAVILFVVIGLVTDVKLVMSEQLALGRSAAWWATVMLIVFAASEPSDGMKDEAPAELERILHFDVRTHSLADAFPTIWSRLATELLGIVVNPFLFAFFLPERAQSITDFLRRNSVEGMSAFATFDVRERGFCGSADQREKVLRSMRNFDRDNQELEDHTVRLPRTSPPPVRMDFRSTQPLNQIDVDEAIHQLGHDL